MIPVLSGWDKCGFVVFYLKNLIIFAEQCILIREISFRVFCVTYYETLLDVNLQSSNFANLTPCRYGNSCVHFLW